MSYEKLDIYNIAFELFIETHKLSLQLPNYELHELGSQLRRSADSVVTNIA
ncbi:four helix bundle protein [Chryseobacterium sp. RRHN12]|uniref:four helix bundle protein n=1 Tax=Chryseobacterium sp. RRHN12 TaxID=3437884 RepID=UPI003D9BEA73